MLLSSFSSLLKNNHARSKYISKKKTITLFLAVFALLTVGIFTWATTSTLGTTGDAEFEQEMRNALGELSLANSNDANAINATPDNLANFIYNRSGVQLNQANKNLLRQVEQQSWDQSKRITQSSLTDVLTQVSFERLVNLSDSDIDNMAVTLTGFNAPDLLSFYQTGRDSVMLRWTGDGRMTTTYFKDQVKTARNNAIACQSFCSSSVLFQDKMARTALHNRIANEISSRMGYLGKADTSFSGGNVNDMTPAEAMLITYSVITNDPVTGSQSQLQQKMTAVNQGFSQINNQPYASPQGHRAFGTNGYLYSSPATLLLDDVTTTRVINLIKEESNIQ